MIEKKRVMEIQQMLRVKNVINEAKYNFEETKIVEIKGEPNSFHATLKIVLTK